ncbi:MAG: tetratricopeptide repeat protein [Chloroflexota bacterium]|nr:tetratricopeptide repeat protein [Chloroflexota bacterium]
MMGTFQLISTKRIFIGCICFLILLMQGCASDDGGNADMPNIEATITAAIAKSYPTPSANVNNDLESEIQFRVQATIAAQPVLPGELKADSTYLIVPTPRPMIQSAPTAEPIPVPTAVPTAVPTPTLVPPPPATPTALQVMSSMVDSIRPAVVGVKGLARSGSGVVIETSSFGNSAIILSNYHIVEGSASVIVTVGNSNLTGQVIGGNPSKNLSLIYVCCGDFMPIPIGDSESLSPGDRVISVQKINSEDDQPGFVESLVTDILFDDVRDSWIIRTDAPIDGLNSGNPMISLDGEFIAINAARVDYAEAQRDVSGTSFGIAQATVSDSIPSLKVGVYNAVPLHPLGSISHGSYYDWAYNQYYAGEYDLALNELKSAILLDRDYPESYLYRGMIYEMQGKIGMAIADYDLAASFNPRLVSSYVLRAKFYFTQMDDYLTALKNYELSLDLSPLNEQALSGRADSYYMIGQYNQSIKDYGRVIELYPDSALAYEKRSLAYDQTGESDKAQADRDKACQLSIKHC